MVAKKILFADDDPLVGRIYQEKLVDAGYDVLIAEDGVAALKLLLEFKPDLVVLDLLMPKMNGADVLKYIRQHPQFRNTRVIIFSNSFLAALVEQVGELKVEKAIAKSAATPARLIELIERTLNEPPNETVDNFATPSSSQKTPKKVARMEDFAPLPDAPKKPDNQFRTRVRGEFAQHLPQVVADIRQLSKELFEAPDVATELKRVEDLSRKVGFLTQMGSMAECGALTQLSSALELLLFHLHEKKVTVAASPRNTIAAAVAFLTQYLHGFDPNRAENPPAAKVLVVDDDLVLNRGVVHALVHANVPAMSATDPNEALEKLRLTAYDLILLDVALPGMDGMALCEKIRQLDLHKRTPVIFITGHNDSKTRARSILSGGNDFISKPILPIELAVKVITLLMKKRFDQSQPAN